MQENYTKYIKILQSRNRFQPRTIHQCAAKRYVARDLVLVVSLVAWWCFVGFHMLLPIVWGILERRMKTLRNLRLNLEGEKNPSIFIDIDIVVHRWLMVPVICDFIPYIHHGNAGGLFNHVV